MPIDPRVKRLIDTTYSARFSPPGSDRLRQDTEALTALAAELSAQLLPEGEPDFATVEEAEIEALTLVLSKFDSKTSCRDLAKGIHDAGYRRSETTDAN